MCVVHSRRPGAENAIWHWWQEMIATNTVTYLSCGVLFAGHTEQSERLCRCGRLCRSRSVRSQRSSRQTTSTHSTDDDADSSDDDDDKPRSRKTQKHSRYLRVSLSVLTFAPVFWMSWLSFILMINDIWWHKTATILCMCLYHIYLTVSLSVWYNVFVLSVI